MILGDLSIQGNIKPIRSLAEPLQVAMDNGARKALIPLENKRNFLEVSGDIVERVDAFDLAERRPKYLALSVNSECVSHGLENIGQIEIGRNVFQARE